MTDIDVDHVLQLEQELEAAKDTTIKQLLERQKQTADQLKMLGYEPKVAKPARSRKPCSKCQATDHDARFHRGDVSREQGGRKPVAAGPTAR
ncbi:MAG TPA: hypothetical protein VNN25_12640 [Thermoanaerobaculia bacterium]|nr:hypothetical protein [Thermoanaerobaculia bacterium]